MAVSKIWIKLCFFRMPYFGCQVYYMGEKLLVNLYKWVVFAAAVQGNLLCSWKTSLIKYLKQPKHLKFDSNRHLSLDVFLPASLLKTISVANKQKKPRRRKQEERTFLWHKNPFWECLFLWHRKFKYYSAKSFCFCFHDRPIWEKSNSLLLVWRDCLCLLLHESWTESSTE